MKSRKALLLLLTNINKEKSFDVTALANWDDNMGMKLTVIKDFNMCRGNGIPKSHI